MKTVITTLFLVVSLITNAQISRPSLSPRIKTEQKVGMASVKLDYGQPNMQKRKIFGALIPFNKIWRTGANASTKITFNQDVQLTENIIPAGTYALYTIPEKDEWTIIIHKNSTLWGAGKYDENDDLIRFKVPVIHLNDTVETFSIHFESFTTNGGNMVITWENTKLVIPLFVDSDKVIFDEISLKINATDKPVSAKTYFDAAQFYYLKKKDLDTAMLWFDKAIELKPKAFWFVYYKAELAYYLKKYNMAKVTAKKCLEAAKLSTSSDYGFISKSELLLKQIADSENNID